MKPNEFIPHPDQKWGCLTYAQHGDDLMLLNLFQLMDVKKPSYLDLGAHHPFIISNTALLYERGSRGVNIEANPNLIDILRRYRPDDQCVQVGVGPISGVFPFYMYSDSSGRNTFSFEEVKTLPQMTVRKTESLAVMTIMEIVERFCNNSFPDLLCTDIEGMDLVVLSSADFSKTYPKVICTETRRDSSLAVKTLLTQRNYFCYCRMGENLFFIHNDFKDLVF